jgi:hypothetical protein
VCTSVKFVPQEKQRRNLQHRRPLKLCHNEQSVSNSLRMPHAPE